MAKINIPFGGRDYLVDESSIATATAQLQSHLSTVMNGSGSVIKLGGISYNIDSTKLSNATNAFITHLGTIAGSGSKVVVNGVEYAVDSTKITNATNDLHTTLTNLHTTDDGSGDSGSNEDSVTVLLEPMLIGPFNATANPTTGETIYGFDTAQAPVSIEAGKTYIVDWDGTQYTVDCRQDGGAQVIGNLSLFGYVVGEQLPNTGEPFVVIQGYDEASERVEVIFATTSSGVTHTFGLSVVNAGSDDGENLMVLDEATLDSNMLD